LKTGAAAGAFDLFHREHKKFVDECRGRCDRLVVYLEDDELVAERRGSSPILDFATRQKALLAYGADEVRRLGGRGMLVDGEGFDLLFMGDRQRNRAEWKSVMDGLESRGRLEVLPSGRMTSCELRSQLKIYRPDPAGLSRVTSFLEGKGIEHCAMFGALLGMMRNGRKVPWDKDYDLLVMGVDIDEARDILVKAGMQFRRMPWYLSWPRETKIDLFFLNERGRVQHLPEYRIDPDEMRPFERGTIDGVEVFRPRNARTLVDANYPGWECNFSVWKAYKPTKFDVNF
jgi:glycerol-3-phosphate cytidylyltransferase-like family protein